MKKPLKHFIDLNQIKKSELFKILTLAKNLKKNIPPIKQSKMLLGKNLAMIFEKNSTRTRVSFEVAIKQLGGGAVVMNKNDMQLGKGETISDTAKVLSRYVDFVMIRTNAHKTVVELAENSAIPVINGLSDFSHPCQILASLMAIEERLGNLSGKKITWCGDQNNVLNSYIHAANLFDFELAIASPKNLVFSLAEIKKAQKLGAKITLHHKALEAARESDVIVADTWFSMGDKSEKDDELRREKIEQLKSFQVNKKLMSQAKKSAIFTHCLPLYRGYEVTAEVADSDCSIIFEEAENRLHVQKAILLWLSEKN